MRKWTSFACLIGMALILAPALSHAQDWGPAPAPVPAPVVASGSTIPTGFMIEGVLSGTVYATDGFSIFNAAAVPNAIIGYRMEKLAIGLGLSLYRGSTVAEDTSANAKQRESNTSMLFSPRFEISLFRSTRAAAEAYLVASMGVGFNVYRYKLETPLGDNKDTDTGVAIGAHVGMGGRIFFGGGPFALGMEFGWSGLFLNMDDNENTEKTWLNISGIYGALVGTFVFG
jgi:hypothetical protein